MYCVTEVSVKPSTILMQVLSLILATRIDSSTVNCCPLMETVNWTVVSQGTCHEVVSPSMVERETPCAPEIALSGDSDYCVND